MTLQEKLEALKLAGLNIGRANPREAYEHGFVGWQAMASGTSEWYDDDSRPFVELRNVQDDDAFGQADTVSRSNYRSLRRDFPNVFLPVSYSNTNGLGAFVHSMSDDHVRMVTGLADDYPLYDESDHSALESEEITDSWDQYLRRDMDLSDEWEQVADLFTDDEFRDAFFDAMWWVEYYPEHSGVDVLWDMRKVTMLAHSALSTLVAKHLGPVQPDVLPLAV